MNESHRWKVECMKQTQKYYNKQFFLCRQNEMMVIEFRVMVTLEGAQKDHKVDFWGAGYVGMFTL